MKFRSFNFFFREAAVSLKRNTWMVVAATGTVAVSLIIFGISLLLVSNINFATNAIESDVTITAYLKNDVDLYDSNNIKDKILKINGVETIEFVSKNKALEEWKKSNDKVKDMVENIGRNPLPDQYRIKAQKAEDVVPVAKKIEVLEGVDKVKYGQGYVEKLFALTKWVRYVGYTIMALLGLAALFLISTSIRLTLYARRKEIQIMKFVGATDWFIRWPYLLEGMFIGLAGAALSMLILFVSYTSFVSYAHNALPFMSIKSSSEFMASILGIVALAGFLIGTVGSLISIRKYLKV